MIDHIGIDVSNYEKSKSFYTTVLKPLGYELLMEFGKIAGFGANKKPEFWISEGKNINKIHIAFKAESNQKVDEFYKIAIEVGAQDNGKPGLREMYHPKYYGAFIFDPDGNNIEAVCHNF